MSNPVTIYKRTIDSEEVHLLCETAHQARAQAHQAAMTERGVEFVLCDTATGEWLDSFIMPGASQ